MERQRAQALQLATQEVSSEQEYGLSALPVPVRRVDPAGMVSVTLLLAGLAGAGSWLTRLTRTATATATRTARAPARAAGRRPRPPRRRP